jgi:lipid-binding SYLF domain-containing protein
MPFVRTVRHAALAALLCVGFALPTEAQISDQQDVLNRADVVMKGLRGNKDYAEVDSLLKRAKAVFIVPQMLKGAFFVGGAGGNGVMVSRNPGGGWSAPAFYVIGSASFGLQFGAKSSEVVFLVMTDKGLDAILKSNVKLGADVSVALVTVGKGLEAGTGLNTDADIFAVQKSDGLFAGAALDGSVISARDEWDQEFYGQSITARDIFNGKVAVPPGAEALIGDLN